MGDIYDVKRVYVHGKFDTETLFNDIAMLTLKKKILFNRNVAPICLPHSDDYLEKVRSFNVGHLNSYFYYLIHVRIMSKNKTLIFSRLQILPTS